MYKIILLHENCQFGSLIGFEFVVCNVFVEILLPIKVGTPLILTT